MIKRSAFSFIELVFSIVIVGIVVLSIPLIVRQSNANLAESQNVIGFYNALTLMETVRNKPWDKNNVSDFDRSGEYYILDTGEASFNCKQTAGSNVYTKPGLGVSDGRRMCDPLRKTASANNLDTVLDSINSFNGYRTTVKGNGNDIFVIDVGVRYVNVNFGAGTTAGNITTGGPQTTDVKAITVNLNRNLPDGSQVLVSTYTYYAANIGTGIPYSKDNI